MFHVKHFVYFVSGAKQEKLFRRGFWAPRLSIQPQPTAGTYQRAEAISAADRREAAVKKRGYGLKMKILFSGKNAGLLIPPVSAEPRRLSGGLGIYPRHCPQVWQIKSPKGLFLSAPPVSFAPVQIYKSPAVLFSLVSFYVL